KVRLHERLAELSETWGAKLGLKNVSLDSYIISATPYDVLRQYDGDGSWSKKDFADRHIFFFETGGGINEIERLFAPHKKST
ncbi:hypothetical protein GWN42_20430, partial [candidate division KSB1 bacterium]|nr:hypothetical protein [candidate division KSB1 bacterium]NIR71233.1 hypothetical protein [candidate division KSB1 bacterium]NIS26315.1 hypothetical protein [candidate division KSB1 bacterium]NIU26985.1 hypothetical protein [candidate division KSB1 bacterium]NIV95090.1 hypothetical protein [candidate division KSB1 bacterium]